MTLRSDDFRAVLSGTMTHAEFAAKWPPVTPQQVKAMNALVDRRNRATERERAGARRSAARIRARRNAR